MIATLPPNVSSDSVAFGRLSGVPTFPAKIFNSVQTTVSTGSQDKIVTRKERSLPGETPVYSIPFLSDLFRIPNLLVKDEGANPCGTHKDRKSVFVVNQMSRPHGARNAFCLITAGNAALSLSYFAKPKGIPVIAFVGDLNANARRRLELGCSRVINLDLEKHCWTNKKLQNLTETLLEVRARNVSNVAAPFISLAQELIPYKPDTIVLPVGGAELFVGLAEGLQLAGQKTRLIGIAVRRRDTLADKLFACHAPYRDLLRRWTRGSSPHQLIYLDDESRLVETKTILSRFLRCEPSSAVAFDALRRLRFASRERVVVINTGAFRWRQFKPNPIFHTSAPKAIHSGAERSHHEI